MRFAFRLLFPSLKCVHVGLQPDQLLNTRGLTLDTCLLGVHFLSSLVTLTEFLVYHLQGLLMLIGSHL